MKETPEPIVYRFGSYKLDIGRRLLFSGEDVVALPPKAFDILSHLVKNGGEIVSKQDLMSAIWDDSFVEENNLTVNMTTIRKALGEKRGDNKFIVTVPGRGYRFVADLARGEPNDELIYIDRASMTEISVREEFILDAPTPLLISDRDQTKNRRHVWTTAAIALAVLIAGTVYFVFFPRRIDSVSQVKSLAVLPFKPLAMSEQDAIFGVGMADAVIGKLSRISGVTVRPTSAIVKYAASKQDLATIGRDLTVDALLDGTIQRSGNSLRVSVQLIRVSDNAPLWTKTFDTKEEDVFTLQDQISEQVADSLALKIGDEERRQITKHATNNPEAYRLYLNGLYQLNKRSIEAVRLAVTYFEQALEKQPDYALAYAGLGDAYIMLGNQEALLGAESPVQNMPKAKSALTKALNLDNSLPEAHASMAWVTIWETGDVEIAKRDLVRALELNPNLANAHHYNGLLEMVKGRFDDALAEERKAQAIDQFSLIYNINIATMLFRQQKYDEAEVQCRKTIELDQNFARAYWLLGLIYEQKHQYPSAIESHQKAVELSNQGTLAVASLAYSYAKSGQQSVARNLLDGLITNSDERYVAPDVVAMVYGALGDKDKAFTYLGKAVGDRPFSMFQLNIEQRYEDIRKDPRFPKFVAEMQKAR